MSESGIEGSGELNQSSRDGEDEEVMGDMICREAAGLVPGTNVPSPSGRLHTLISGVFGR